MWNGGSRLIRASKQEPRTRLAESTFYDEIQYRCFIDLKYVDWDTHGIDGGQDGLWLESSSEGSKVQSAAVPYHELGGRASKSMA